MSKARRQSIIRYTNRHKAEIIKYGEFTPRNNRKLTPGRAKTHQYVDGKLIRHKI